MMAVEVGGGLDGRETSGVLRAFREHYSLYSVLSRTKKLEMLYMSTGIPIPHQGHLTTSFI